MQEIGAAQLIPLSVEERLGAIQNCANQIDVPSEIPTELNRAYQISKVLTPALPDFIQYQIDRDVEGRSVLNGDRQSRAIASECDRFADRFTASMPKLVRTPAQMESSPRNLYEMCGAAVFTESNAISSTPPNLN